MFCYNCSKFHLVPSQPARQDGEHSLCTPLFYGPAVILHCSSVAAFAILVYAHVARQSEEVVSSVIHYAYKYSYAPNSELPLLADTLSISYRLRLFSYYYHGRRLEA